MSLLEKLFPKKQAACTVSFPTREEIIAHMQDEGLSSFSDTVVRKIASSDRSKRILILRSDHGYYKTVYEEIRVWNEEEWKYCPDIYPAHWQPVDSPLNGRSFYGTEGEAMEAITASFEYNAYFL